MNYEIQAPVREVTVYPERALVVRRGVVTLTDAGEHTITLSGLPQGFLKESLRVSGRSPGGSILLGVDLRGEFHADAPEEQIERLRSDVETLEREIAAFDQRTANLKKQSAWLNTMGEQAARSLAYGLTHGTAQPDDATRVFTFVREENDRVAEQRLTAQHERSDRQKELEARRRELDALTSATGTDRLRATIRVQSSSAGEFALELSYQIYAARWSPRYDARVNTQAGRLRFTQQALVNQWSSEDWSNVRLTLSTARPSAAMNLPDEAPAWYIDQRPPIQPRVSAAAAVPMRASRDTAQRFMRTASAGLEGEEAEMMAEAAYAAAPVERAGAAQVFYIDGNVDIPSDGQPHLVGLGDADLPMTLEYVTAPVLASGAHLRAVTINTLGHLLPAGSLHVFHLGPAGDEYVGETMLEATAEGAPLKLFLGVDDNVTVKRELVERDTDKGNLLQGSNRRTTIGYKVTLANRTQDQQRVTLLDRLPIARHERIKVKLLESRPQPGAQTRLDQLTWTVTLAPGEERKIEWRFLVESPAEMDVVGLP